MNAYAIPGIIRTIGDIMPERISKDQLVQKLESAVCTAWGIHPARLHEQTRERVVVEPRQLILWWMDHHNIDTLANIGKYYNKDHSTVLHARRVVSNLLETNYEYRQKYEAATQLFEKLTAKSRPYDYEIRNA